MCGFKNIFQIFVGGHFNDFLFWGSKAGDLSIIQEMCLIVLGVYMIIYIYSNGWL